MKNINIKRWFLYFIGMLVLCFGLIMNQKSNLGVSAIASVSYIVTLITGISYGDTTFIFYIILVIAQFILIRNWKVFLQLPISIIFTRFMNLFSSLIIITNTSMIIKLICLSIGIICTGIGASITLNMNLIPNPGDGMVDAFSKKFNKEMGLSKNIVDSICFITTLIIGLITGETFSAIGIGTILSVIFVGRVIALFNHYFKDKMKKFADIQ